AALSSFAMAASAMTAIEDTDLSQVSGQDGVSIAANLNINIGSFVYTDTDATGGSVSFNNVAVTGSFAATIDIINNASFQADASAASGPTSVLGVTGGAGLAAFMPAGDVVKIAVPQITVAAGHELNMSVASIKMGNSAASFGSFAMNDIKLQGTTVYIWAH
ncbi:MAG: hypothetical protein Q7R66_19320, partial [Undibacterium sp.]|uniref:DUF6160 family protein n=1 Tax=Undibacterium sp. TaxID=1914977 RepID=UPI002721B0D3